MAKSRQEFVFRFGDVQSVSKLLLRCDRKCSDKAGGGKKFSFRESDFVPDNSCLVQSLVGLTQVLSQAALTRLVKQNSKMSIRSSFSLDRMECCWFCAKSDSSLLILFAISRRETKPSDGFFLALWTRMVQRYFRACRCVTRSPNTTCRRGETFARPGLHFAIVFRLRRSVARTLLGCNDSFQRR